MIGRRSNSEVRQNASVDSVSKRTSSIIEPIPEIKRPCAKKRLGPMVTCACGNPANDSDTTCQRCSALYELGLKTGATDAEVKTAYRLCVKAWHQDRFPGDEWSKSAAQERLKAINSAYDYLTSSPSKGQTYRPKADAAPPRKKEPSQQKQSSTMQPPPVGGRDQEPPPKPKTGGQAPPPKPSAARRWGILFGLLAGSFRRAPRWL